MKYLCIILFIIWFTLVMRGVEGFENPQDVFERDVEVMLLLESADFDDGERYPTRLDIEIDMMDNAERMEEIEERLEAQSERLEELLDALGE